MTIFGWLKFRKRGALAPTGPNVETPDKQAFEAPPTEAQQFKSPVLLAAWVSRSILEGMPLEDNYSLLPDEESRKALNITFEQRERYIREIPVLRVAGVSLFVRRHYDDAFWLAFSQSLYPLLATYLRSDSYSTTALEVAEAVEGYVDAVVEEDDKKLSLQYLHRVYDDSDHFSKLLLGGVSSLASEWLFNAYDAFREAHCQITKGMSYKSIKAITEAIERVKQESG
jgi:hypothetical protein